MIKSALNEWSISFDNISHAFRSYFAASTALDDACSITTCSSITGGELEELLAAIDSKLGTIASWIEELIKNRSSLSKLRNNSTRLSPINKLPPEVLGHIFSLSKPYCIFDEPDDYEYFEPASVCTYWRQVALSKAELWTHIDISVDSPLEFATLLLKRSRDCPIHVHIYEYEVQEDRDDDEANDIITALMPHIHRVSSLSIKLESEPPITSILTAWLEHGTESLAKKLSIDRPRNSIPFYYIPETIDASGKRENMLRSLDILHLGYIDFGWGSSVYRDLTDLRLVNKRDDHTNVIWVPHLYDILHASPRLVTLKLAWLTVDPDEEWVQPPGITFNYLRVLCLDRMRVDDLEHILPLIALPDSPNELNFGFSIDTQEAVDIVTRFLGHTSVPTLYLSVEDGCDYEPVIRFSLGKPSILPQTLILGQANLEEVLPNASGPVLSEKSVLGSVPNLVLYDCMISEGTLERLIIRYNVQTLWLDTCATLGDNEDIADIQALLLERHPKLKWLSTDTFPEGPDPCRPILDMFD